jgi:lipopolysaccharide transport system ATP-binding protein
MSDTVIRVENLSKKYIIRHQQAQQYTALRDVIADGVKSVGRRLSGAKQDPSMSSTQEEFWALKDVSFEVKQGDRIGIIGRNGAGKSTLLKILSRIVEPTTGKITLNGRVASLLEVGTGFHPELTGRENIYLNGAILGMSKIEIKRKFDEIVDFAEIEKFLDTPVKKYSSGMYVRLAFAVAAHLEPEILIVDEVLAVGDVQFQKKCLGKMEKIGQQGRTILFVSHNITAIKAFCKIKILMRDGEIALQGTSENIIDEYLKEDSDSNCIFIWDRKVSYKAPKIFLEKAYILNCKGEISPTIESDQTFSIILEYETLVMIKGLRIGLLMRNNEGVIICGSNTPIVESETIPPGHYKSTCIFPGHILNTGQYSILFGADSLPRYERLITTEYCISFNIEDVKGHGELHERLPGILRPQLIWQTT